jgi:hypothetical protein
MGDNVEEDALDTVVDRLSERFPSLARQHVREIVDEEQQRLEGAPIRDFVPVLVEHAAKERLREEAEPVSIPVDEEAAGAFVLDDPIEPDPMEVDRRSRPSGLLYGDLYGGPN